MGISAIIIIIVVIIFFTLAIMAFITSMYKKVPQGQAIVRSGAGGSFVSFDGIIALPVVHQIERVDMSIKKMNVSFSGEKGLLFKDGVLANMEAAFFLRINPSPRSILAAVQSIGAQKTFDEKNIYNLFESKFKQTVRIVATENSFDELHNNQEKFLCLVLEQLGCDLNGYVADDFNISHIQKTAEGSPS